jgi:hypothetical protein
MARDIIRVCVVCGEGIVAGEEGFVFTLDDYFDTLGRIAYCHSDDADHDCKSRLDARTELRGPEHGIPQCECGAYVLEGDVFCKGCGKKVRV